VLAVFLVPGPAGSCLPRLFFTALVQFISLPVSPNAAAWFSDFDSVLAWVSLLLLKGLGFQVVCSTQAPGTHFGVALPLLKNLLLFVDLLWFECEWLQGEADIVLESPVQKTRDFVIQIALPRWFPECVHQLFGEMYVRI
jgi:hypothetical protein